MVLLFCPDLEVTLLNQGEFVYLAGAAIANSSRVSGLHQPIMRHD